jgi:hypothetical protein
MKQACSSCWESGIDVVHSGASLPRGGCIEHDSDPKRTIDAAPKGSIGVV